MHKAVPKGTLSAILISTLVYVMLAWFVGACVEREALGLVHNAVNATNGSLASCVSQECQYGLLNDFQVLSLNKIKLLLVGYKYCYFSCCTLKSGKKKSEYPITTSSPRCQVILQFFALFLYDQGC